jgi:hypothetical protein
MELRTSHNAALRTSLLLFLVLVMLAGCTQENFPDRTPSPPAKATQPEITPTIQVSATPTIRSSPTSTRTFIPTMTPLPTLPADVATETIVGLIQPGEQCALPCFLGITPGESAFDDIYNRFSQFSEIGYIELSSNQLSFSDWFSLDVNFPTYTLVTQVHRASGGKVAYFSTSVQMSLVRDEKWVYDDPTYVKLWHPYFLPGILSNYGRPGQIFLDTTRLSGDPSNVFPFVIWVVYPEHGFLIRYEGDNTKVGDNIRICPLLSDIKIISWRSETTSYERYIEGDMAMGTSLGPQPIEEVTDFDIDSFYNRYKDAQAGTCFNTPASLWP